MEVNLIKKTFVTILGAFFIFAGSYHFINPNFYLGLIPDYLPLPVAINYVVGILEIVLGIFVLIPKYRKVGGYGIILLLILLIPSHVFFIQIGSCVPDSLCVPNWLSWSRLIVIHPLLVYWAYRVAKN
ncbi:MauE/DoxX family redox-associated membrane protein [Maribacter sp. R77961]|uniref:DoxX family protein n=1 Tax=Maribacter sp. R77961 TaxID=3093871 RepID=UPI0037C71779